MTNKPHSLIQLNQQALEYHTKLPHGKISISAKSCNPAELALAYTPGVAHVCTSIQHNPELAYQATSKGNMVAVISNGTAVLGLGDIGALAGKPVMEGKALLFKLLAGIDAIDLCINEHDITNLTNIVKACEVSFGAINLEDIKAPGCFTLLENLQHSSSIPVFHDDQDGTAIVVTTALLNALKLLNKPMRSIKIVCSGAGAAMIATLRLLEHFGLKASQVTIFDSKGSIHSQRTDLTDYKRKYAHQHAYTFQEALTNADVFIGLSGPGVLKQTDILHMSSNPILLCLANPIPEITPEEIQEIRPDAIIGTGSSRYPNQVNNALCFPYIFRAALDARVPQITLEMMTAFVQILTQFQQKEPNFDREHLMPNLLDQRLPYIIVPHLLNSLNIKGPARHNIYIHKYPNAYPVWESILKANPNTSLHSSESWLQDSLHLFNPVTTTTNTSPQLKIKLINTSAGEKLPDTDHTSTTNTTSFHILETIYGHYGIISPSSQSPSKQYHFDTSIDFPVFTTSQINLTTAKTINKHLAIIIDNICYIDSSNYSAVTFIIALLTRLNIK